MTNQQTADAKIAFLAAYAESGIKSAGLKAAGVHRSTCDHWLEHDEEFSRAYHVARAQADDAIRAEINRRAIEGTEKPIYQGGKLVGHVREYSDTLLIFLAKSRMAEFREKQQIEHTGDLTLSLQSLKAIRQRASE